MSNENQNNSLSVQANKPFNFFDKEQFATMQRICTMFANSELVPEMYRVSEKNSIEKAIANCMIAVDISQRIGANVLMIMQNLVVIHGRPSWSSKFLVATVNTCGRFEPLQYKFGNIGKLGKVQYTEYNKEWVNNPNGKGYYKNTPVTKTFDGGEMDNIVCTAYTRKKGSSELLESSPISIEMAIKEGWYTKAGSKWQTMPKQMLMYRAASFWTSAYAPDLSMGMKTSEEVYDIEDAEFEDVSMKVQDEIKKNANMEDLEMKMPDENAQFQPSMVVDPVQEEVPDAFK